MVADDVEQAAEDLRRDWSTERTPTWAIDTGLADHDRLTRDTLAGLAEEEKVHLAAIAHAQIKMTAKAITGIGPPESAPTLADVQATLRQAQRARAELDTGQGCYQHTDAGRAVADLAHARATLAAARRRVEFGTGWRNRRAAAKEVANWEEREEDAQQHWRMHIAPEAARLDAEVSRHMAAVEQATARLARQAGTSRLTASRLLNLQRTANRVATRTDAYRDQLDGLHRSPAPRRIRQRQVPDPTSQHEPVNERHFGPAT
jgi:hypothetical protein